MRSTPQHDDRAPRDRDQPLGCRPAAVRPGRRAAQPRPGPPAGPARAPSRADRPLPGEDGRRVGPGLHRLPRPAQPGPRAGQGRHPLPPGRQPRRGQGPRDVDDLEVRGRRHPVRRRQGRRDRRPQEAQPEGAGGAHPTVLHRDRGPHRPRARHPGPGREHQRPDHGLDHGHVLDARGPHGPGRRDRQADQPRRVGGPQRGDRPRHGLLHHRGRPPPGHRPAEARVAIQGFGNAGSIAATLISRRGRDRRRRLRLDRRHPRPGRARHQPGHRLEEGARDGPGLSRARRTSRTPRSSRSTATS